MNDNMSNFDSIPSSSTILSFIKNNPSNYRSFPKEAQEQLSWEMLEFYADEFKDKLDYFDSIITTFKDCVNVEIYFNQYGEPLAWYDITTGEGYHSDIYRVAEETRI